MKRQILVAVVVLAALSAPGFAQYYAGPTVVSSEGLGYESPYAGLTLSGERLGCPWIVRAEVSVLQAKKLDTGTGNAASGELRVSRMFGRRIALGVGIEHAEQFAGLYEKGSTVFGPELMFLGGRREFRASFGVLGGDAQVEQVLYIRLERVNHHRFSFLVEDVQFKQEGASESGRRIAFHYGFPLKRRSR
ncbi:MAG: hypothetical protein AMXMBFR44_0250 [Candidatus Campbellbacteria bacterium]